MTIASGSLLEVVLGVLVVASYGVHAKRARDLADVKRTIRDLGSRLLDPDGDALHDLRCARNRAARIMGTPPEALRPERPLTAENLRRGIDEIEKERRGLRSGLPTWEGDE